MEYITYTSEYDNIPCEGILLDRFHCSHDGDSMDVALVFYREFMARECGHGFEDDDGDIVYSSVIVRRPVFRYVDVSEGRIEFGCEPGSEFSAYCNEKDAVRGMCGLYGGEFWFDDRVSFFVEKCGESRYKKFHIATGEREYLEDFKRIYHEMVTGVSALKDDFERKKRALMDRWAEDQSEFWYGDVLRQGDKELVVDRISGRVTEHMDGSVSLDIRYRGEIGGKTWWFDIANGVITKTGHENRGGKHGI